MLVATFRHADNYKGPDLINPGLTEYGKYQAGRTSSRALPHFEGVDDILVISSPLARADETGSILSNKFREKGVNVVEAGCPHLNAQTAEDHIQAIQVLWHLPQYCIRNGIPVPQAAVLVTHAHNVVGHLVGRMLDPEFHRETYASGEFIQALANADRQSLDTETFERLREAATAAENGLKAEYAQMDIFKLDIEKWSDIHVGCGHHAHTVLPTGKKPPPTNAPLP